VITPRDKKEAGDEKSQPNQPNCPVTRTTKLLSIRDTNELMALALDYENFIIATASENRTMQRMFQQQLLSDLRRRIYHRDSALAIARNFGWAGTVDVLGEPNGERLRRPSFYDLQREAGRRGAWFRCGSLKTHLCHGGVLLWGGWRRCGRLRDGLRWQRMTAVRDSGFQV